ncbi:MAG: Dihydroorotate dehydrogenase (quinone) [uncultured Sphingomonadaceae bacterium]|uniref:Dihydroorotate dehydrogenase (quinone) n=1 Tax=uncultured Sphingomonadaceae bacterium TaxID=169976 RepID=A0A6J4T2X5_9SPHN|nr:MAG: Dihydroorotate dehydrogenase (quinone) [uncultured Sphingomonadaceae bacterium]
MTPPRTMALFPLVRPLLFALDPERAHDLSLAVLRAAPLPPAPHFPPSLASTVAGLRFPSPVGLAAGYDKNAQAWHPLLRLGFGSVEVGTLTPRAQPGNPRPRLFRLAADRAVVNRFGFNNGGQAAALDRLRGQRPGIIGVNVGANKDSADRIADYAQGVRRMAPAADYLTINISSPNTPGLRALQGDAELPELLAAVREARPAGGPPVFLKVAPDLTDREVDAMVRAALDGGVDALIVANTTVSRPNALRSPHAGQAGGLSGAPLGPLALDRLRAFRVACGGRLPLIAAGGIGSAADAYARIGAGASLVQLYSALVYEGPGLPRRIARDLAGLLARDGFGGVEDAVGSGCA